MSGPLRFGPVAPVAPVAPVELASWLEAPGAFERFSPLTGSGLLVLDLTAPGGSADPDGWHGLAAQLLALPCPVIALRPEATVES